jgi:hypothetical protein
VVQDKAKYLGFVVGPGRDDSIWDKPVISGSREPRTGPWSSVVYNTRP